MTILEDIAERPLRIDVERGDLLGRNPSAHDQVEQAAQQREEEIAGAERAERTGSGRGDGSFIVGSGRSADLSPFSMPEWS